MRSREQHNLTERGLVMKNVEYLVMMEAAENLYIVQKEYQEYIDEGDVQGALNYKKKYLDEAHKRWNDARDALRIKYPDDKQYMEALRDATNEGEHNGEIASLRMRKLLQSVGITI